MGGSFEFTEPAERFAALPQSLRRAARTARLGPTGVPALLAHPDWRSPAPTVVWLHGRTAYKELDPGRYSRWLRAGMAACAIDLPGHGERADGRGDDPANSLGLIAEGVAEIDGILEGLVGLGLGLFDMGRLAIGGMSMGGMITLRRLCDAHPFKAALVEATTGDLAGLYTGKYGAGWPAHHEPAAIEPVDPSAHLEGFRPIPLLAIHSEADTVVPWACQDAFLSRLRAHYEAWGSDGATERRSDEAGGERAAASSPPPPPAGEVAESSRPEGVSSDRGDAAGAAPAVRTLTWPQTGAPDEHIGFGKHANDAKNAGTAFLGEALGGGGEALGTGH